jgi:hypothetical protein
MAASDFKILRIHPDVIIVSIRSGREAPTAANVGWVEVHRKGTNGWYQPRTTAGELRVLGGLEPQRFPNGCILVVPATDNRGVATLTSQASSTIALLTGPGIDREKATHYRDPTIEATASADMETGAGKRRLTTLTGTPATSHHVSIDSPNSASPSKNARACALPQSASSPA